MGLVFKENQPLLGLGAPAVVHFDRDHDRAGVVFIGHFHVGELSVCLELLHAHNGQIHQTDRLVAAAGIQLTAGIGIALPGCLDGCAEIAVFKLNIFEFCGESGVTAVIRPIGVQHPDLGDGGIAVLCVTEIGLDKPEIRPGHGKAERGIQLLQCGRVHAGKAVKDLHIIGFRIFRVKSRGLVHTGLAGIHRVDAVGFDTVHILFCEVSGQQVGDRSAHHGLLFFIEELQALLSAVRALVKLTRQGLDGKHARPLGNLDRFFI